MKEKVKDKEIDTFTNHQTKQHEEEELMPNSLNTIYTFVFWKPLNEYFRKQRRPRWNAA